MPDSLPPAASDVLDYAAFDRSATARDPFPHLVIRDFVPPARLAAVVADLPEIADELTMEIDELFPLLETLQLLRFAEVAHGDVLLTAIVCKIICFEKLALFAIGTENVLRNRWDSTSATFFICGRPHTVLGLGVMLGVIVVDV